MTLGVERWKGRLMEVERVSGEPNKHRPPGKVVGDRLEYLTREAAAMGRARNYGSMAVLMNARILEMDPGNYAALIRRGRCYQEQDEYAAAQEDYSRALRTRPGDKLAEEALEKIESEWVAWEEREKRRTEKRVEKARAEAGRAQAEAKR